MTRKQARRHVEISTDKFSREKKIKKYKIYPQYKFQTMYTIFKHQDNN